MADPVLPGGIRVLSILQGVSGLPEDRYVNTWAFSSDAASSDAAKLAACTQVKNFFDTAIGEPSVKSYLSATSIDESKCEFRAYWMGDTSNPRTPYILPWAIGTLGTGTALPSEVACVTTFYATASRPRTRGRVFIGPLRSAAVFDSATAEPKVAGDLINGLNRSAKAMAEDITEPVWCVLAMNETTGVRELKTITGGWTDNAFDTQRRRGAAATQRNSWLMA